jgi:hypothetical protein
MDECKEVLAEKGILYTKTGKGKKTRVNLKLIDKGQEKV